MRFYTKQHTYYLGIDLHTKKRYLCVVNRTGEIVLHGNIKTDRDVFLKTIEPFLEDIVVAVECMFTWYWIADLCTQQSIPFVLGHALYMKATHGGKAKNDEIDSQKIGALLKGGMIPMAYVSPAKMRATRGLLRRRNHLMRKRAELYAHVQNTPSQQDLPHFLGCIAKPQHRESIVERFEDPSVQKMIDTDLAVIEAYDAIIAKMERDIISMAKHHDPVAYVLLQSIPGIGGILGLVICESSWQKRRISPFGHLKI